MNCKVYFTHRFLKETHRFLKETLNTVEAKGNLKNQCMCNRTDLHWTYYPLHMREQDCAQVILVSVLSLIPDL